MGENNLITLRNASDLQLFMLEDTESLSLSETKFVVTSARRKLESALAAFLALNEPRIHHRDVALLKTNLGFIHVWQEKPKKARKLLRQLQQMDLSPQDSLAEHVAVLKKRVDKLKMKRWNNRFAMLTRSIAL